jgi:hypothetical protein
VFTDWKNYPPSSVSNSIQVERFLVAQASACVVLTSAAPAKKHTG